MLISSLSLGYYLQSRIGNVVYQSWLLTMRFNGIYVEAHVFQPRRRCLGCLRKACWHWIGISLLPSALARIYIWLDVDPAASISLATRSQLRISVDILRFKTELDYIKLKAFCSVACGCQRHRRCFLMEKEMRLRPIRISLVDHGH